MIVTHRYLPGEFLVINSALGEGAFYFLLKRVNGETGVHKNGCFVTVLADLCQCLQEKQQ